MSEHEKRDSLACATPGRDADDAAGVSRRRFLQALGIGATAATIPDGGILEAAAADDAGSDAPLGPGPVAVKLDVNGKTLSLEVEPRTTLLDALRDHLQAGRADFVDLTGTKRVCDRASCGACTVIINGRTAYACTTLALEAQGKTIRTVEGLEKDGKLHPVQEAFVHRDGLMCGFCTPGFVMASVALLESNPSPSQDQIRKGLDGNICRCGTQCRVFEAVEEAASKMRGGR
jgi:xanthine dehydrogenase YagT iron-sulfur-binding subunit